MKKWALALAALAVGAPSFAADVAKGNFHFGPIKFDAVDAIAYQVEVKDAKPVTIIAFSDFKIDRQGVMDAIDTGGALITQINASQKGSFVMVRLTAPNRCGLAGLIGAGAKQIDLGDSFTSKSSQGVSRVAGECFTTAPGKMFDDVYDFHLTYDQPLLVIPRPATLPAGGGEPGAAFAALVKAIQAADWKGAHLLLRQEEVPETPPKASAMKEYFHDIGLNYPKTVTVIGGLMKGDRANLDIKGTDHDGKKIKGVVAVRKVAGNWRVIENSYYFDQ
jgi:hypothetical protein